MDGEYGAAAEDLAKGGKALEGHDDARGGALMVGQLRQTAPALLWLAAAHINAATRCFRGPPACSGRPSKPRRGALAVRMPRRGCSMACALTPVQRRSSQFHRLLPTRWRPARTSTRLRRRASWACRSTFTSRRPIHTHTPLATPARPHTLLSPRPPARTHAPPARPHRPPARDARTYARMHMVSGRVNGAW